MTRPRIVLAYGGSLAGAAAIASLREATGADIVTLTLDLGQGLELEQARDQAIAGGALRAHVHDGRAELANELILPALRAGALGPAGGPRAVAITRPLIVQHLVAAARMERATSVAHGALGADRACFDRLLPGLAPDLTHVAVADLGPMPSAPGPTIDANLWGRTVTYPAPADGWHVPPSAVYTRTSEPAACAAHAAIVEIAFEQGVPTAINGVPLDFAELVEVVDTIAGDHGIGRFDLVARDSVMRQIAEAPAALVLSTAMAELVQSAMAPALAALWRQLSPAYADLVDQGRWFSSARQALDAFNASAAAALTGTVRLLIVQGACRVVGRQTAVADGVHARLRCEHERHDKQRDH